MIDYNFNSEREAELLINYNLTSSGNYDNLNYIYSNVDDENFSKLVELMNFSTSFGSEYKGQILGNTLNATGHFSEGSGSKGFFFEGQSYINIADAGSQDYENYSFIFSQEKVSVDPEIIFSNFQNDINDPKGFEFGINAANKLYFEYINSSGSNVFTLNTIAHKKNIYSVEINKEAGRLNLSWWNPYEEDFDSQSFYIDSNYIIKSDSWNIGSGSYSSMSCNGYVDRFLFFDNLVGSTEKELICRSMYQNMEYIDPVPGVISGAITGYSQTLDETVSGITGYETIITGYTGNEKFYERVTGYNLYGTAISGEYIYELDSDIYTNFDLYEESITGIYKVVEVDSPTYGVTGFESGIKTESYYWDERPLYFYSGVSGELYKTYIDEPLTGDDFYYRTAEGSYSLSGKFPLVSFDGENGYGPRSHTYLGARNSLKDLIETQKGINLFSVNNFAGVNFLEKFKTQPLVFMPSDVDFNYEDAALYINGVSQSKGVVSTAIDGKKQKYFYVENGSFAPIVNEVYEHSPFYAIYEDAHLSLIVDSPVVDVLSPYSPQYLKIEQLSQYLDAPFAEINPAGAKVFFNGKKLYEGIDYINDGGKLDPIGDLLQITGVYSTEGGWRFDDESLDVSRVTGYGEYDMSSAQPFIMGSIASSLNGIKLDPKSFIYHDSSIDLLSQGYAFIVENEMQDVYNNRVNEFLTQEVLGDSIITMQSGQEKDYIFEGAMTDSGKVIDSSWNSIPGAIPRYADSKEITNMGYDEV